jgi:ribosomal protein uL23
MSIIKYPLSTEKAIRLMESNNTLVFAVDKSATKKEIKNEIEELYDVKIKTVNVATGTKNQKKAYIKFSEDTPAIDLATQLGLM